MLLKYAQNEEVLSLHWIPIVSKMTKINAAIPGWYMNRKSQSKESYK